MTYTLYPINDNSSTTFISEHTDLLTGVAAGQYAVEVEDYDYAYCLHTADDVRVSTFGKGRIGYREWAYRTGRLEFISSEDDKYLRDEDEWVN